MEKRASSNHFIITSIAALVGILTITAAYPADISLEAVTAGGVKEPDRLNCGTPVSLYLRVRNSQPWPVTTLTNTFRLFSTDGAMWQPQTYIDTTIDIFPPPATTIFDTCWYGRFLPLSNPNLSWTIVYGSHLTTIFELGATVEAKSMDGREADTIAFAGQAGSGGIGILSGFDEVVWSISLDSIECPGLGESYTLCIDSVHQEAAASWIWSGRDPTKEHSPTWAGPHCFAVYGDYDADGFTDDIDNCPSAFNPGQEDGDGDGIGDACSSCCSGIRGNCDGDLADVIDIIDLTYLVAYMFKAGPPPICLEEANVNGVPADADILDLTYLVEFMFKGGPQPTPCEP